MTYREAVARLRELAGGQYCSISYETRSIEDKETNYCCLYVADATGTAEAQTWDLAFEILDVKRGTKEVPANQGPMQEVA